jgi:TolB-like protein
MTARARHRIAKGWLIAVLALLGGCADLYSQPSASASAVEDTDIRGANYAAAEQLVGSGGGLDRRANLVGATFVNIIDLDDSSAMGKLIAEQIGSRLTQLGYRMVELKLRNDIFIQERGGEYMLSRTVQDISAEHDAQAVIAGTYAVARDRVYVKASVIEPSSNVVMASYDYELPLGRNLRALLYTRQ